MTKKPMTDSERISMADLFIDTFMEKESFLMVGHDNPDEDCIASMVSISLLLIKFKKSATIVFDEKYWDKFSYLLNNCKYNSITVLGNPEIIGTGFDVIIICDTPKFDMLQFGDSISPLMNNHKILVLELDHHLGSDGEYIGQNGYCFVDQASSTCELIGYIVFRLCEFPEKIRNYNIKDLFSRNLVLSILTGMIGDSKLGQFLKTEREKEIYKYFTQKFETMLKTRTNVGSDNFSSIEDILLELEKLSSEEEDCYQQIIKKKKSLDRVYWIALDDSVMKEFWDLYDYETVISVAKYSADHLAEESNYIGIIVFYDHPDHSDLIQFRVRRSRNYKKLDLRILIDKFNITNGGGHEGAIGFRIPKSEIKDFDDYVSQIVHKINELSGDQNHLN